MRLSISLAQSTLVTSHPTLSQLVHHQAVKDASIMVKVTSIMCSVYAVAPFQNERLSSPRLKAVDLVTSFGPYDLHFLDTDMCTVELTASISHLIQFKAALSQ